MAKIINKNWNVLQTNPQFGEIVTRNYSRSHDQKWKST